MSSIKFTKERNYLEKRLENLKRFNSRQEKDSLLSEDNTSTGLAKILSNITPDNKKEAYAFITELRKISVSDIIDLMVTCPHCKQINNFNVDVDEFLNLDEQYSFRNQAVPVGLFENPEDIINIADIESMSVRIYRN